MTWKPQAETEIALTNIQAPDSFAKCWAASVFLDNAFYPEKFQLTDEWETTVVLSSEGNLVVSALEEAGISLSPRLIAFIFLRLYYWSDILIDHTGTDSEKTQQISFKFSRRRGHPMALYLWPCTLR